MKSVSGRPPFTPNETGCAVSEITPKTNMDIGLTKLNDESQYTAHLRPEYSATRRLLFFLICEDMRWCLSAADGVRPWWAISGLPESGPSALE